jgi:type III secretory pathway component EscS
MIEIQLLKIAIGALVTVITVLIGVIVFLFKKMTANYDQIIAFAVKLIETGVPNETFENVASWLKTFKNGNGSTENSKTPGG